MYVKLLTPKQIPNKSGKPINHRPGDWVDVPKQVARRWIAAREAAAYGDELQGLMPANSGIKLPSDTPPGLIEQITTMYDIFDIDRGSDVPIPYSHTLVWDAKTPIEFRLFPVALNLLKTWQVAVPLLDYKILALHLGTQADRKATQKLTFDLRIPVYNSSFIAVKRCSDTEVLFEQWEKEQRGGGDKHLAFLRAVHITKPLILPLPPTWTGGTLDE